MKNKEFYVSPETEVIEIRCFESTLNDYTNQGIEDFDGFSDDIGWGNNN